MVMPWMPRFTDLVEHVDQSIFMAGLEHNVNFDYGGVEGRLRLPQGIREELDMSFQRNKRGFRIQPRGKVATKEKYNDSMIQ